jgi:IS5 family transposase
MKQRSAIKNDLFAPQLREGQIDHLGDPLAGIEACIDFRALDSMVDEAAPRAMSTKGGRPPYPTETLVRILVLKRLNNLSDERMEFLRLDRFRPALLWTDPGPEFPDRTTTGPLKIGSVRPLPRHCSRRLPSNC